MRRLDQYSIQKTQLKVVSIFIFYKSMIACGWRDFSLQKRKKKTLIYSHIE